jgi:hypothetical protein
MAIRGGRFGRENATIDTSVNRMWCGSACVVFRRGQYSTVLRGVYLSRSLHPLIAGVQKKRRTVTQINKCIRFRVLKACVMVSSWTGQD